jgi:hypothetical protein
VNEEKHYLKRPAKICTEDFLNMKQMSILAEIPILHNCQKQNKTFIKNIIKTSAEYSKVQ